MSANLQTRHTNPLKAVSLLLDPEQSEILSDTGEHAFAVVGRDSYPNDPARWVIHLVPTTIKQADAAARVARGLSKESKPRKPKS